MKIMNFRNSIWQAIIKKIKYGRNLPRWAIFIRCVLFPLDSFFWYMSKSTGYQPFTDTWIIDGEKYTGEFFYHISKADGDAYRITRIDGVITFKKIDIGSIVKDENN